MDELTHRNVKALADGLNTLQRRDEARQQEIAQLRGQVVDLTRQLAELQPRLTALAAAGIGTAATAR